MQSGVGCKSQLITFRLYPGRQVTLLPPPTPSLCFLNYKGRTVNWVPDFDEIKTFLSSAASLYNVTHSGRADTQNTLQLAKPLSPLGLFSKHPK